MLVIEFPEIGNPCFVSSFDVLEDLCAISAEYWPGGSGMDLEGIEGVADCFDDCIFFS
jgi:hypothetical protein